MNQHTRLLFLIPRLLDTRSLHYLVDWVGYSPSDRTWERVENVANARALVEEFHQQYLEKPGSQPMTTRNTRHSKDGIESCSNC